MNAFDHKAGIARLVIAACSACTTKLQKEFAMRDLLFRPTRTRAVWCIQCLALVLLLVCGSSFANEQKPSLSDASIKALDNYWAATSILSAHYREKRFNAAYAEASRLVVEGNVAAAYWLGRLLIEGNGVERDVPKAVAHLQLADAGGVFQAARLLANLYYKGELLPQDRDASRRYQLRGFQFDRQVSEWKANSLKPRLGLFHPAGEAVWFKFWSQRAIFLKGEENATNVRMLRKELDVPPFESNPLAFNKLPDECRPKSPPWAMRRLKLDTVTGDILFRVNDIGRVDGIYLVNVSDSEMTAAAFETFFDVLTNARCVPDVPDQLRSYQIPFTFRLE